MRVALAKPKLISAQCRLNKGPEEEQWTMEREECVAQLIQHCNQLLLTDEEECIYGWALVDPFNR